MTYNLENFLQYEGLTDEILKCFDVSIKNRNHKNLEIYYPYLDGTIMRFSPYMENKWTYHEKEKQNKKSKIFRPNKWYERKDCLVLAEDEIDTMSLYSIGIPAIYIKEDNSDQINSIIDYLKKTFEEVVFLIKSQNQPICFEDYGVPVCSLPNETDGKSVSCILSEGFTKEYIELAIRKGISKFYRRQVYYNAGMLKKMEFSECDYIIPGILSKDSLIGLVGGSDSGKSLLALQFAVSYVLGKNFLGQKINGGKKALFCSLEDSPGSISRRFKRLMSGLDRDEVDQVESRLFFSHIKDSLDLEISHHLLEHFDTGLIIIDTFSELASGKDINSAGEVRKILKPLHQICLSYDVAIVIIHHIGKSSERSGSVNKLGVLGSQSFEAMMRSVFQMKKLDSKNFQISVIKGNDIVESIKSKGVNLIHSSENLWFSKASISIRETKAQKEKFEWRMIFREDETLSYSEIKNRLMSTGIAKTTAENRISKLLGGFKLSNGLYKNPEIG
jgi:hypothetical protein